MWVAKVGDSVENELLTFSMTSHYCIAQDVSWFLTTDVALFRLSEPATYFLSFVQIILHAQIVVWILFPGFSVPDR